nr:uncharacterized protein LOC128693918 isoform X2 [Cherax quadricarinatus]
MSDPVLQNISPYDLAKQILPQEKERSGIQEINHRSSLTKQSEEKLNNQRVSNNAQDESLVPSADVGTQDNNCHVSPETLNFTLNSMKEKEYSGIAYSDWYNRFDQREVRERKDSDQKDTSGSGYITCHSTGEDEVDGFISNIKEIMSRQRSESVASLDYYRSQDTSLQIAAREELQDRGQYSASNGRQMQQSRRLPFWLWFIIAKSLGIKLHAEDKPIIATVLYTITFMSALGFLLSSWWFTAYDIVSDYTKTTVIDGSLSIFFSLLWGALAVYANNLAYRLFSHKKFLDMLRLHSKTILKMNASFVLFTLMLLLAICNDLNAFVNYKDETCQRGIRRFMQALEQDSRVYEARYMGLTQQGHTDRPVLEEYSWVDEDYMDELRDPGGSDIDANSAALVPQQSHQDNSEAASEHSTSSGLPSARVPSTPSLENSLASSPSVHSLQSSSLGHTETTHIVKTGSISSHVTTLDSRVKPAPLMSNSEILFRYWKIQARLRLSSVALQRWMMSVICLVVMWLAMNLVMWLKINPNLIDLANFFLPLSLLPLLSSAYAEVNQEGIRLLKFICPLEERLQMLYILQNAPLQMTVYGFSLSYSTITTAAFGILLAFASKVLIQEISGPVTAPNLGLMGNCSLL